MLRPVVVGDVGGDVRVSVDMAPIQEGTLEEPSALTTEAVWVELRGRLRAFIARRVNGADVDDVVQGVFLQLHRSLAGLRRTEHVHAWVYRTARNAISDHYRSTARRRELPSGDAVEVEEAGRAFAGPGGDVERRELRQLAECLSPMIDRLPDEYRQAIVSTEIDGRSQREAAEAAGLSLSGMKSRVQRARQKLKGMLLDCCQIALDRRGGISSWESRPPGGGCGHAGGGITEDSACTPPSKTIGGRDA